MENKLPEGWEWKTLGEIGEICSGGTPSTRDESNFDGDIPWITPADLSNFEGIYIEKGKRSISEKGLSSSSAKLLPKNSVIFSSRAPIGYVAIASNPLTTNQGFKNIILKEEILSEYVYYYLKKSKRLVESYASGTTFLEVSATRFSQIPIIIPPLETQQKIVYILEKAEETKKFRAQADELTQKFLQSVFLEMFGDPVKNSKQFDIIQLKSVFSEKKEGTKCGPFGSALKKHEYVEDGISVWTMDNIAKNKFTKNGCLFITEEKYRELKAYSVNEGDILISRAGTVGKMCVVNSIDCPSIISTNLIRLSLNPSKIKPIYFTSLMTYFKGRIGRLKTGEDGTYTFMNTGILKDLRIPLPPFKLQSSFVKIVEQVEKTSYSQQQSSLETNNLFDALMQKAFTGELVS